MLMALSITAIIVSAMYPLYFALQKDTSSPPGALSTAVMVAAALELFDLLTLCNPEQLFFWKKFSITAEALLAPSWLWFATTFARRHDKSSAIFPPFLLLLAVSPAFAVFALSRPASSLIYSPDFVTEKILFLSNSGFIFYLLILVYLVIALFNLEVTFIHSANLSRWKIKFELLGAGAFLALLIIYYCEALFFRTINMQLVPTRSLLLIVAVSMMAYSRLKRGSAIVCVSQQLACKSAVLLAVGIYILSFGLAGEGMKYFGDGFQRAMIITVVFLAGLGLLVLLLSEAVKRKVTVFIHKNFYHNKYDYRTQWLKFTDRLSSSQSSEELLRSIVSEFCDTFGMGTGALFTLNQERDTYQQTAGIVMDSEAITFSTNDPVIERLANGSGIIDLRRDAAVTENIRHSEYFGGQDSCFIIPIIMNEGVDGFMILGKPLNTDEVYGYEDFDLMNTLAKQTSSALLKLRLSDQLACSRELAAIGKVSAFVMHDLKNLVSSVSLLLENAQEHISVPAFQNDLLMSLGNTVVKMKALISRLKHLPEKSSLILAPVDLLEMAQDTASLVNGTTLEVTGTRVIAEVDREELQKVALNLMLNAVEATAGNGPVRVEVGDNGSPFIRVKDEGCGIPPAFLQHVLFKPFTSTKSQGMGIGLYQSRQIIEAHGGRIEVVSNIDQGSEFTVWLPRMQEGAA